MIDEDAIIDKAIRIAPLAIGGFLVWKVLQGGFGSTSGSAPSTPSPPLSPQGTFWLVEVQENGVWRGHSTYPSNEEARAAARRIREEMNATTRVVLA